MFIHLHGHSHYSLLEAIGKPADIVAKAKEFNMPAIALTDYNGMFGAVEFFSACKQAEIKPIIGVEIGFVPDHTIQTKDEQPGNIVLLAKNYDGYQELMEITSQANLHGFHEGKARIDWEMLPPASNNLYCLLGGENSYIGKMILANEPVDKLTETIGLFDSQFGQHNVLLEYIVQYEHKLNNLKQVNNVLVQLNDKLDNTCIATSNFHYINRDDKEAFEVALAIKDGKRLFDKERRQLHGDWHIMDETEIKETATKNGLEQDQIATLCATTKQIADEISVDIPMDTILFPNYDSPPEIKELYKEREQNG